MVSCALLKDPRSVIFEDPDRLPCAVCRLLGWPAPSFGRGESGSWQPFFFPPGGLAVSALCALSSSGGDCNVCLPNTSTSISEKKAVARGPSIDSGKPMILMLFLRLRPSRSTTLAASLVLLSASAAHFLPSMCILCFNVRLRRCIGRGLLLWPRFGSVSLPAEIAALCSSSRLAKLATYGLPHAAGVSPFLVLSFSMFSCFRCHLVDVLTWLLTWSTFKASGC